MGLFSSYDLEYGELYQHLTEDWAMKPAYAKPFMDAYKKSIGKKLSNGRRRMESNMAGNDPLLSLVAFANVGQELDFSLVAQAYEAYMTDLRRGRHVGTAVEKAIWAILYNRSDLIETIDRPFQKYIDEKCDEKFPALLDEAFEGESHDQALPSRPNVGLMHTYLLAVAERALGDSEKASRTLQAPGGLTEAVKLVEQLLTAAVIMYHTQARRFASYQTFYDAMTVGDESFFALKFPPGAALGEELRSWAIWLAWMAFRSGEDDETLRKHLDTILRDWRQSSEPKLKELQARFEGQGQ